MKLALAFAMTLGAFAFNAHAVETRCGWINNPTPANYTITDAERTWVIAVQGGYQAEGVDKIEYPSEDQYVDINGSYGYWCGCMKVETDTGDEIVEKIFSSKAKLLKDCLKDPNLPSMK
jgi:hypothetical protein